jgi:hypothetical protein
MRHHVIGCLSFICLLGSSSANAADYLDLATFGRRETYVNDGARATVVTWDEERDVREIRVRYNEAPPTDVKVQYWFRNWPYPVPRMPTMEDPVDDLWQGKWLTAQASRECQASECTYTFQPLAESESQLAKNLPGTRYRRTLKIRLVSAAATSEISALQVFSETTQSPFKVRVELGRGEIGVAWTGAVEAFNGGLRSAQPWGFTSSDSFDGAGRWRFKAGTQPKGLMLDLSAANPAPPGSADGTIVTIKADAGTAQGTSARTFSFATDDLKRGPIEIPAFHAYIMDASSSASAQSQDRLLRVRQLIPLEPEQTYERASREIPALDPWNRENNGRVYLPLAADSSWQKFAFDYGGNVFISKHGTKAKGRELDRLQWEGDRILWKIGTGETPYYREDRRCAVSKLEGYLPVITQRWENEDLKFTEEAFATLLSGPLSPEDAGRNEQTPAILMIRLTAENPALMERQAHVWLSLDPGERLSVAGNRVEALGDARGDYQKPRLRAVMQSSDGHRLPSGPDTVHLTYPVPARGTKNLVIRLPFVSDVDAAQAAEIEKLDYDAQRNRVVAYWKDVVRPAVRFSVPEPKFNDFLRSVIAHMHISTTKDAKSGLYMVPAASYVYDVFANESCFQTLLLDTLGQTKTAGQYLEAFLRLQGSRNFPGLHRGPPDAIFHGAKVDDVYDYTAHNYGLDHGTVLWTLAEHYLYSRDRTWFEHAWPHMKKAIDWIVEQRRTTKQTGDSEHARDFGLLPASQLEDNTDWANWFAINAYAWAGVDRSAQALKDLHHPDADGVAREADEYKKDLRDAVIRAASRSPVVRMRDGIYEPYVPVEPFRRLRLFGPARTAYYTRYGHPEIRPLFRLSADREGLYGPMILLNLGVFSPEEAFADWVLDDWEDNQTLTSGMGLNVHGLTDEKLWFSQGGMVFQANLQNPIQVYLKRHEIPAAIRGVYNNFVSCLYPDVNVFTEEYHQWRHASGPFYKISDEARFVNRLRDMLALEDGDTLWLAPGTPRRWLESKDGIRVSELVTYFGPVSYTMRASGAGRIEAGVQVPTRNAARTVRLVVRTPSGRIRGVTINGRAWTRIDPAHEAIELPQDQGPLQIHIRY